MTEVWKAVVGLEGRYEVSSLGRIRSLDQTKTWPPSRRHPDGHVGVTVGKVLATFEDRYGYAAFKVDGRNHKVHQTVAAAFIGPRPAGLGTLHRNDIKSDNRPENLHYGDQKTNGADGAANRTYAAGARHYATRLTDTQVAAIKSLRSRATQSWIARAFGISQPAVHDIQAGKTWAHIAPSSSVDARRGLDRRRP